MSVTRFPGKPLVELSGKSLIKHVYENVSDTELFEKVIVATDDKRIFNHVTGFGGACVMTGKHHKSGTDRIAEVCSNLEFDIVVNIQGDEPLISKKPLEKLITAFDDNTVNICSLMQKYNSERFDANTVKVVVDKFGYALYFSRSDIPFGRDEKRVTRYKHIGIYAFRKKYLLNFVKLPQSSLEITEKLEQLRLLENGFKIKMVETEYAGIGIDTRKDLEKVASSKGTRSIIEGLEKVSI